MKTKLSLFCLLSFVFYLSTAQVPQGFNYQAVARTTAGEPLVNLTNLQVMLYIQSSPTGGTMFWKELHNPVSTNAFGAFTLVLGTGVPQAGRTVSAFNLIDWSVTPKYIKTEIYYSGSWKDMGNATQIWSVPYAVNAQNALSAKSINADSVDIKGTTTNMNGALFEVKNKDNQTVFAVYNEGVRIWVADGAKGNRGGFAVGGFDQSKTWNQEYFRVTADSTRVYTKSDLSLGQRGGFAVGSFNPSLANKITTFTSLTAQNNFIGHESGLKTDPKNGGLYNSFFGYQTGKLNVTGTSNVFIGYQSGMANTASNNVFIGYQSGLVNTSGYNNIFLGYKSGWSNTIGDNNVFIGNETGYKTTGAVLRGDGNVFIGYFTGHENITGTGNSFIGYMAGYSSKGKQNAFVGNNSGYYNGNGNYNVYIGPYAGRGSSSESVDASNNVFIGNYAGESVTSGSYNAIIGFMSGRSLKTGNYNVFVGPEAGYYNEDGQYNTFLGYQAGYKNIGGANAWEGEFNTFLGYQAGYNSTSGYRNIAIGYMAGYGYTSNRYNICIGEQTGTALAAGQGNVIIGTYAGEVLSSGDGNILLGLDAGYSATTATDNVMIGLASGRAANGSRNVFIGKYSGYGETGNDKLVIENGYTGSDNLNNALIYGDFSAKTLKLNGNMGINVDPASLYGFRSSNNATAGTGVGVRGDGGATGVAGYASATGTGTRYGVYGYAIGGENNRGVYGYAPTTANSYAGYFSGNVYVSGTVSAPSDARLKKNIENIPNALSAVLSLTGVSYKWKTSDELATPDYFKEGDSYNMPAGKQVGLIAQEVEEVIPEVVSTNREGYKSIDYSKLTPYLIEAIKEQQRMIDELKTEIEELKKK